METTTPNTEVAPSPEDRLMAMYADEPDSPAEEPIDEPEAEETEPTEEVQADQTEEVTETEATDGEEVEFDGKPIKLPTKIAEIVKKADSLQADYTRKTQEVAEQRKSVEDRGQYLEAREMILSHAFKEAAEVESITAQLQQFDALDWNSLFTEDSQRAMQLSFARQQLQSKHSQAQAKLNETIAKAQQAQAQHLQKQTELGRAELGRRLGKATEAELQATWKQGLEIGFSEEELKKSTDPRLMHALYKAAKFEAMSAANKTAVEKKVSQAKPMTAPAARNAQGTAVQAKQDEIRARLKKTGKSDDAETLLRHMFERKRVR